MIYCIQDRSSSGRPLLLDIKRSGKKFLLRQTDSEADLAVDRRDPFWVNSCPYCFNGTIH